MRWRGSRGVGLGLELRPPALGEIRLPGERLRPHHRRAVELVALARRMKADAEPRTFAAAAALAESLVRMVDELIGHDLSAHRQRLADCAHFGGLIAAAEESNGRTDPGSSAPHADLVLACVAAQFSVADRLAEQLFRWSLEAGYFLVRTGFPPGELLGFLQADLVRLIRAVDGVRPIPAQARTEPTAVHIERPVAASIVR